MNQMADVKKLIKQLGTEKGILSRKIGEAKAKSEDVSGLIAEMQALSAQLKALEAKRAELDQRKRSTPQAEPVVTSFPGRFTADVSSDKPADTCTVETVERVTGDAIARLWNDFVDSQAQATVYHRYEFKHVIEQSFGHETYYFVARNASNKIIGVLPAVRTKSRLFGDYITSMPFFNYGGPLSSSSEVAKALISNLEQAAKACGSKHVELRECFSRPGYPSKTEKVSMFLRLPDSADQLFNDIGAKVRAQIKKGEQNGFSFKSGGQELLADYYHVFAANMRDLGTPVYNKRFFANLLRLLPDNALICVLYHRDEPVSCAFLIGYQDTMEIPWASTVRKANPLNANMVLYWHVLQLAIGRGYLFFDFGRSTKDASTFKFKKQWGAQPATLYWHYWLRDGDTLPQLNPNNPKFKLMIWIWQKLPVFVTKLIGPPLVKSLP